MRPWSTRYSSSWSSSSECSLIIRSPVLRPVKLLTPKDAIPKWCLTGRYGAPPSSILSIASKRVTEWAATGTKERTGVPS